MPKMLQMKNGEPFIIDDEDFERVSKWSWHNNGNGYIRGKVEKNGKKVDVLLHRFIMNPPDDKEIDHINHNLFDNRKANLRIVDRVANAKNRRKKLRTFTRKGYVNAAEATGLLGYSSTNSLYVLVRQGKLTKYKVLGKTLFSIKEIEQLLKPSPEDSLAPKPEEVNQSVD